MICLTLPLHRHAILCGVFSGASGWRCVSGSSSDSAPYIHHNCQTKGCAIEYQKAPCVDPIERQDKIDSPINAMNPRINVMN